MTQPTRSQIDAMTRAQAKTWAANNGGKTGAPPGLLQDDSRKLSRALANAPHARQHVREACQHRKDCQHCDGDGWVWASADETRACAECGGYGIEGR